MSYHHMAGVASRYGETGASPYLLPISVDGLVIVASISLIEIAGRIHAAATHSNTTPQAAAVAPDEPAPTTLVGAAPTTPSDTDDKSAPRAKDPCGDDVDSSEAREVTRHEPDPAGAQRQPEGPDDDQTTSPSSHDDDEHAHEQEPQDAEYSAEGGSVPSDTAAAVAYWYRRDPNLHPAEIGAKIGRSERTVRRYWPPTPDRTPATATNGDTTGRLVGAMPSR